MSNSRELYGSEVGVLGCAQQRPLCPHLNVVHAPSVTQMDPGGGTAIHLGHLSALSVAVILELSNSYRNYFLVDHTVLISR